MNGKSKFFDKYLSGSGIEVGESTLIDDSEDTGGKISGFGIEYRKIDPVVGLPLELEKIIALFD